MEGATVFLAERADMGVELADGWTPASQDEDEVKRLMAAAMMALAAGGMKRRLGHDVTRQEASRDKTVSRMVGNLYLVQLTSYGARQGDWLKLKKRATVNDESRSDGARVIWPEWLDEQIEWTSQAVRRTAALAIKSDNLDWGNKRVFWLEREVKMLKRIRRKYEDG
jgi:hypothetical protein